MLGRLQMSIQECTAAYVSLSSEVFRKSRQPFTLFGKVQGRFDDEALENAVKKILVQRGLPPDELLKDAPDSKCKVYVAHEAISFRNLAHFYLVLSALPPNIRVRQLV